MVASVVRISSGLCRAVADAEQVADAADGADGVPATSPASFWRLRGRYACPARSVERGGLGAETGATVSSPRGIDLPAARARYSRMSYSTDVSEGDAVDQGLAGTEE